MFRLLSFAIVLAACGERRSNAALEPNADPCLVQSPLDDLARMACLPAKPATRPPPSAWVCETAFQAGMLFRQDRKEDLIARHGWSLAVRARHVNWFIYLQVKWVNAVERYQRRWQYPNPLVPCLLPDFDGSQDAYSRQALLSQAVAYECAVWRLHQRARLRSGVNLPVLDAQAWFATPEPASIADRALRADAELLQRYSQPALLRELLGNPTCLQDDFSAARGCACAEEGRQWDVIGPRSERTIKCHCENTQIQCTWGDDRFSQEPFPCPADGPPTCCGFPPVCTEGEVLSVRGGCWACLDDTTCTPRGSLSTP